jgi:tRNA (guanine37-N1)-methyltransferase
VSLKVMAMRIDILTLFPEMFGPVLSTSILGRAIGSGLVEVVVTNIRDFARDKYRKVDDAPFGGGVGMVMMCQPIFDAVEAVRSQGPPGTVVLLSPQGRPLRQEMVEDFARRDRLILIAGHYEGFDERIRLGLADVEVSLGDFVLSGGELPALAVTDAVVRLLPGALGDQESTAEESFSIGLLEYPQYTRPREFRGMEVPEVLTSGDHARIAAWRADQAELRTRCRRPDLWQQYERRKQAPGPARPGEPQEKS